MATKTNKKTTRPRTRKKPKSNRRKWIKRLLALAVFGTGLTCATAVGAYVYLKADVPSIQSLADYSPPQVTRIYSDDGHLIGELFNERRSVVSIADIPEHVVRAFLAAEDSSFYEHAGLDYAGIFRAAIKNLRPGAHLQGASTITQQTVKTLVVGAERSYTRKMREAILTRELEQMLSKDEILHLYLNQIYFGSGAHGVEEAALTYFGKSVRQLTLGEAAYLASAPKSPNRYTVIANPVAVKDRQKYVLGRMQENGWATAKDVEAEIKKPVPRPPSRGAYLGKVPHYIEHIRRNLIDVHGEELVYEGGLRVYTGMHAETQVGAQEALRLSLEEFTQKQHGYAGARRRIEVDLLNSAKENLKEGFKKAVERQSAYGESNKNDRWVWDLSLVSASRLNKVERLSRPSPIKMFEPDMRTTGLVVEIDGATQDTYVDLGSMLARVTLKSIKWARPFDVRGRTKAPRSAAEVFRLGDLVDLDLAAKPQGKRKSKPVIEGRLVAIPKAEGAAVAIAPHSRLVRALVGGYDQVAGGLIRATQSVRQPGSSFKPLLYTAAIAEKAITPASICPDTQIVIRDQWTGKSWKPENYDGKYLGDITYRKALTLSKNSCSVKLIDKIGPKPVIEIARKLGIKSDLPENLTLALGTGEVTPLELANAYATLASGGLFAEPIFLRRVIQPDGIVLSEQRATPVEVLSPQAAYVVTQMMRSVIEEGTAQRAQVLDRPLAGKTGTSQQSRNVWFAGFSPELAASVWVGFDDNSPLGRAYGGTVALPVWIRLMGRALAKIEPSDFPVPEGIVFRWVNKDTGQPVAAPANEEDAKDDQTIVKEAFIEGTEPSEATAPLQNPFLIDEGLLSGP